jgi:hypothetical protein
MSALAQAIRTPLSTPELSRREPLTLLDLVAAASEVASGERETVEIVTRLLASGRVRLAGAFRECHLRAAF